MLSKNRGALPISAIGEKVSPRSWLNPEAPVLMCHLRPPTSPAYQSRPHPQPTARPSGLLRTSAPPEENKRDGQAMSPRWQWGQGVPRPPAGAPRQAQPGPRARAAHTAAPTKSWWEMQIPDSEEEGGEQMVTTALSPRQALAPVSFRYLRQISINSLSAVSLSDWL